ncbi:MAG TPA: ribosome maturation factor RimP [Acidothermales bacterium]
MRQAETRDQIRRLLEPVMSAAGLDLEDVDVRPAGRRRLLRVVVDRDGGVGLDDVAQVSTAASAVLDHSAAMGDMPYVLEVTSPGVDRPLTQPQHWRRAIGRLVEVRIAGGEALTGRVLGVDGSTVRLDVAGQQVPYEIDDLGPGRVQVEFNRSMTSSQEEGA